MEFHIGQQKLLLLYAPWKVLSFLFLSLLFISKFHSHSLFFFFILSDLLFFQVKRFNMSFASMFCFLLLVEPNNWTLNFWNLSAANPLCVSLFLPFLLSCFQLCHASLSLHWWVKKKINFVNTFPNSFRGIKTSMIFSFFRLFFGGFFFLPNSLWFFSHSTKSFLLLPFF